MMTGRLIFYVLLVWLLSIPFVVIASAANHERLRVIKRVEGLHERRDNTQIRRLVKVNPARVPWCGAAVAWAVRKTGGKPVKHHLKAVNWNRFGRKISSIKNARKGDVIVYRFKRGYHVAIFSGHLKNGRHQACGGNMSNRFKCSSYRNSSVRGVRR